MLDTLTQFNHRDFSARYLGTYGWLINDHPKNTDKRLVYISEVTSERANFTDINGGKYHAYAGKEVMFEFLPVDRGWFYGESGAMYMLKRLPARQWHRGICDSNTSVSLVSNLRMKAVNIGLPVLTDIFSDKKPPYQYVKGQSCILSKHFALIGATLYFLDKMVGYLNGTSITLDAPGMLVKQELLDIISRNKYPLTIEESKK